MSDIKVQHVVAAVIVNGSRQVLLAKRPLDRHQGGLWEFPGGKVERGEDTRAALGRELHEELGIVIQDARPLIKIRHAYPDKSILLDVWRVTAFAGEPHGREGQPIEWVAAEDLPNRDFPAANQAIVTAARLPSLYLVTPEPGDTGSYLDRIAALLAAGVEMVQFRAKTLESVAYARLARQVATLCRDAGVRLLLNSPPDLAEVERVGAAGVHLTTATLLALKERPLPGGYWVSASCHSSADLDYASRVGVDLAVVAPVMATATHPEAQPLGWQALGHMTERAVIPVYALGGLALRDVATTWAHGCQGIASISALWNAREIPDHLLR